MFNGVIVKAMVDSVAYDLASEADKALAAGDRTGCTVFVQRLYDHLDGVGRELGTPR